MIIWFKAIYIATSHKKGISSLQLSRDLGITQKSAWFVLGRIRELVKDKEPIMLESTVEVDETYVGGKAENKHQSYRAIKKPATQGRSKEKAVVAGALSKEGKVANRVVQDAKGTFTHSIH